MTKERLSKLSTLKREVQRTKKRLAELKGAASPNVQSKEAIKHAERALEEYLTESSSEAQALLEYIKSIDDTSLREIFMLRYYDGVRSWQRIAFMIGEYDESYVRKKHDRFLKAANKRRQNSLAAK